ncbi:Acyl-CoA N-acyltransferases (NAT) superfamily protein [Abeliophyllum distichum]|uniref:Acyl-CoA N-acyltransferases (NAT) superfamily protein n=1 Tax=Abeliophyllum distichum TaxID=126358 RepID=A0ABD1QWP1_9LAMI
MLTFSRSSRYGYRIYSNFHRNPSSGTMINTNSIPPRSESELSKEIRKLSTHHIETFRQPHIKFDTLQPIDEGTIHENRVEFGQFVAREAYLDEEYWTAAWLRAESHWEDRENDRYADNYKRKFAEQAFNEMKKRCRAQLGEKCACIVTVKKGDRNVKKTVLKSVVGTLDLSIRYLPHGQTFPGELVKTPFFCLVDRKGSSRYGYIANLCIAKSARRQGIASSMLQFAIMSAKQQGADKVFVHVHRHNIPAQGLYQKMGFEVIEAANSPISGDETYLLCCEVSNY